MTENTRKIFSTKYNKQTLKIIGKIMKKRKLISGVLLVIMAAMLSASAAFADDLTDGQGDVSQEELPSEEHVHALIYVEGADPTCTEAGHIGYWFCESCGKMFTDENASAEIEENELTIPAPGHSFNNDICRICGAHADGWYMNSDGSWQYFINNSPATGWKYIDRKWYYFTGSGIMTTGWQKADGKWYCMDQNGAMMYGWLKKGSTWYYLTGSGAMAVGWEKVGEKWYYFTDSGAMTTGWQKADGEWYYMNENGAMMYGWLKKGNTWYYLTGSGAMAVGWEKVDGKWYYFTGSGAMTTGWQNADGEWYYMNESGAMMYGWLKQGRTWYYLTGSGAMAKGWEKVGGYWYYFNSSGEMLTGWQLINGYYYYLYSSGEMACNELISGKWYVRENGKYDTGYSGVAFYDLDTWYIRNGKPATDYTGAVVLNGIEYNVNKGLVTSTKNKIYYGTVFSSIAKDGNIHFGSSYGKYEIECVHACYCDVHSWTNPSSGHLGVDLICNNNGQELLAVASGTVVYVHHQSYENDGSYGSHPGEAVAVYVGNGLIYEYHELHSNSVKVKVGDYVNAGDVIGKVGLTGVTTGYHIHFSTLYWVGAEYTDDLSSMPEYKGPSTDGFVQINPLFFFGESLAKDAEKWYPAHKYEWYGYKTSIPGDPRNYPKLTARIMGY